MTAYIALLRGVNVGGQNKIAMPQLKAACESIGLTHVRTYINSGNIIFTSLLDETAAKAACEAVITEHFGLCIAVCVVAAADLREVLNHAPDWWDSDPDSKHNLIFALPPATANEVCAIVGETKPEYERVAHYGKAIFWSAPLATFHRTRWSKITQNKEAYRAITIRNANTVRKLLELVNKTAED